MFLQAALVVDICPLTPAIMEGSHEAGRMLI